MNPNDTTPTFKDAREARKYFLDNKNAKSETTKGRLIDAAKDYLRENKDGVLQKIAEGEKHIKLVKMAIPPEEMDDWAKVNTFVCITLADQTWRDCKIYSQIGPNDTVICYLSVNMD